MPVLRLLPGAELHLPRLLETGLPVPAPDLGTVAVPRTAAVGRPVTTFPMPAVLRREPITYRQMDYWITRFPEQFSESAKPGRSGIDRALTLHDVVVLRRMARLVDAGFRVDAAARLPDSDGGGYQLTPHVFVWVSDAVR